MRMTEQQWDAVIAVNLKSAFNFINAVLPVMLRQRSGSIINMASVVGVHGNAGQSNYAASKAGLIALAKSIAQEVGSRGIRANAIAPGFIETAMTAALPEDIPCRVDEENSPAPRRSGRRHRQCRHIPCLRHVIVCHRPGHSGRRRHEHVISARFPTSHNKTEASSSRPLFYYVFSIHYYLKHRESRLILYIFLFKIIIRHAEHQYTLYQRH